MKLEMEEIIVKKMITLTSLKEEIRPYLNTLVINGFEIVRLAGVMEDYDDFFWIYNKSNTDKLSYCSCFFDFISLKGKLDEKQYNELVELWNMNNNIEAV